MERRHLTFILLAASMLLTFNLLTTLRQPEEPKAPENQEVADIEPDTAPQKTPKNDAEIGDEEEEKVEHPRQFATLGSVNPADGYRMLITLDSRGASIYRAELSHPGYQSYEHDDDGGYLGQLALEDIEDNRVRINVVGPGTPAAEAVSKTSGVDDGLRAGDILISVNGQPVHSGMEVQKVLQPTHGGDEIELVVRRTSSDAGGESQEATFVVQLRKHPVEVIKPNSVLLPLAGAEQPEVVDHPPAF